MVLWRRDFLDVHIDAQMSAEPGSSFHGKEGQQHEEINLIGTPTSKPVFLLLAKHHLAIFTNTSLCIV
jgi:hypothetical protein